MQDISRFAVPELDSLPADVRERILAVQEKSGFVPNVFLVLARRPSRVSRLLRLSRRADGRTAGSPRQNAK